MNGFALGGGFEIALSCDIIIAAEHARFGLPEPRVGLMAAAGGVHRLPRQIPLKIAMGMMLTGKHITAADALRFGIANEVVPLKDLIPTAEKWAAEIMECSPLSVQATQGGSDGRTRPADAGGDREALRSTGETVPIEGRDRRSAGILAKAKTELDRRVEQGTRCKMSRRRQCRVIADSR